MTGPGAGQVSSSRPTTRESVVIIPTYNEAGNLEELVPRVLQHDGFDVFVVDDNSPDGTGDAADEMARRSGGRVAAVHRPCRRGLGPALTAGYRYAVARGYRYVFQMDADLSHDPAFLPEMRRALEGADVVIGSRYTQGGWTEDWSVWRRRLSLLGGLYSRLLLRMPLRDPTGGFKGFRREALEAILPERLLSKGFAVQIEVNYRCLQSHLRVVELPAVFTERTRGVSKMDLGIAVEALLIVARLSLAPPAPSRSTASTWD